MSPSPVVLTTSPPEFGDRGPDDRVVPFEGRPHRLRVRLPQAGAALDVREQERQRLVAGCRRRSVARLLRDGTRCMRRQGRCVLPWDPWPPGLPSRRGPSGTSCPALGAMSFPRGGSSDVSLTKGLTRRSRGTTDHQQLHDHQRRLRSAGARARWLARARPRQPARLAPDLASSRRDGAGAQDLRRPGSGLATAGSGPRIRDLRGSDEQHAQVRRVPDAP